MRASRIPSLGSSLMTGITTQDDGQQAMDGVVQNGDNGSLNIAPSALLQVFEGVGVAREISAEIEGMAAHWTSISSNLHNDDPALSRSRLLHGWNDSITLELEDTSSRHIARLALAVAVLRESSRQRQKVSDEDLSFVWNLIHGALASLPAASSSPVCTVKGFLAVPLHIQIERSRVVGLLQLHIRLPSGEQEDHTAPVESEQHLTQSWNLAGQGRNLLNSFYATICLFEVSQRFGANGTVVDLTDFELNNSTQTQTIQPTTKQLVDLVSVVRAWEYQMFLGQRHSYKAEWELALRQFNTALTLCDTMDNRNLSITSRYRQEVVGKLGCANRRFGRYEQAKELLELALKDMAEPTLFHADIMGELAVVHRLMGQLGEAKEAAEMQYNTAKRLDSEPEMCRAVGNLGMINYQLFLESGDASLLELAIAQIEERVKLARHITATLRARGSKLDEDRVKYAVTHEAIGLARLSLCYTTHGDLSKAVESGRGSLDIALTGDDSIVIAMSRFFYGRALMKNGQTGEAMQQFNPPELCSPAMALCREPSAEHRGYLQELVDVGVDMSRTNTDGYTALDYAVFSGDTEAARMVLDGLRAGLPNLSVADQETQLALLHKESKLRKGYRELFQEKLRLAFHSKGTGHKGLETLRRTYAQALAEDEEKRKLFEGFKVVPYSKFVQHKRIPHSRDGLAQSLVSGADNVSGDASDFVVFFSYRWIKKEPGLSQPDDENNTQYRRMIDAVETFLSLHQDVDRERLSLWVDLACVDQDNSGPGVAALLINLAQCDAIISLVDADYYSRAWCSVEVLMVQTVKRAYNLQMWYEQVPIKSEDGSTSCVLRHGPMDVDTVMAEKKLTYEEDRPKLQFLERQTKLLA